MFEVKKCGYCRGKGYVWSPTQSYIEPFTFPKLERRPCPRCGDNPIPKYWIEERIEEIEKGRRC